MVVDWIGFQPCRETAFSGNWGRIDGHWNLVLHDRDWGGSGDSGADIGIFAANKIGTLNKTL